MTNKIYEVKEKNGSYEGPLSIDGNQKWIKNNFPKNQDIPKKGLEPLSRVREYSKTFMFSPQKFHEGDIIRIKERFQKNQPSEYFYVDYVGIKKEEKISEGFEYNYSGRVFDLNTKGIIIYSEEIFPESKLEDIAWGVL